ncbi:MAG: ABC transporter ATP-binding protein [bacterium]|nr:ABC transporter ATP-binding protein [bacterium]
MIEVRELAKDYRDNGTFTRALAGVSFTIREGEFVAVMGPSGSGKSTLLHILSFLDRPSGGSYEFRGRRMDELSDTKLAAIRNREMGFVFQSFNLLGRSSVYENVELPLLYSPGVHAGERRAKVEAAVAAVGLGAKIDVETSRLSGGEKQRVAIARALVNDPAVIFADEPTGNLDSQSGAVVMGILKRLNESGRTVILVTHNREVAGYAGRLIRLKDGRVESDAPISAAPVPNF